LLLLEGFFILKIDIIVTKSTNRIEGKKDYNRITGNTTNIIHSQPNPTIQKPVKNKHKLTPTFSYLL